MVVVMKRVRIFHEKIEDGSKNLRDNSVDMVIADPPYSIGVGGAKWDVVKDYMPFALSWLRECVRLLRPGGALLLYGSPERLHVARMSILLVDDLGMRHVQDMPWVYTQGSATFELCRLDALPYTTCLLCIF